MRTFTARCTAAAAGAALAALAALPLFAAEMLFAGVTRERVLAALSEECFNARMSIEAVGEEIIVCTVPLRGDESLDGATVIQVHQGHVAHKIRFVLAERAAGVRVWAYPWLEVQEPEGRLLEEELRSEPYLERLQNVLADLDERLGAGAQDAQPQWAEHYESQDEWRLDAHLRAVAHCDRSIESLTPQRLERELAAAQFQPLGETLRDRCEELYEEVYRWGLARGLEAPALEAYAEHRATLPPGQRACRGRLALVPSCR